MIILSIDPGLDGAFALLDTTTGELLDVQDIPTAEEQHLKDTRRVISAALLSEAILHTDHKIAYAIVEHVSASPQMGTVSAFRMGEAVGTITAVLQCKGIRTVKVRPNIWKKALGLNPDKELSRARAIELWPDSSHLFKRKLDHNRAEACLLAEYGRRVCP